MGHDLGHTPFGHAGERALAECQPCTGIQVIMIQSVRVVEYLEKHGTGTESDLGSTWMGLKIIRLAWKCRIRWKDRSCRLSDKIAYVNHDIDDAIRGGILTDRRYSGVLYGYSRNDDERTAEYDGA